MSATDKGGAKREIPGWLRSLLEEDKKWTKNVCEWFDRRYGLAKNRMYLKSLEVSCHGIPWLGACFAALYLDYSATYLWMNLLWLLILDIIVVAVVKAITRRRRPSLNKDDMFATVSVDRYSFPSGHATRAVALAIFFCRLYPLPMLFWPPLMVWATAVCASRVLLYRHHVLDVVGGVSLAFFEWVVMALTWMSEEKSKSLAAYFFGDDPWSNA